MVYWLRQIAHDQEVMGSNSGTEYWMDLSNTAGCYTKEKFKIKVANQMVQTKIFV